MDSSAILSVIFNEGNVQNISRALAGDMVTSELSRVEVLRNVTKTEESLLPHAQELLDQFDFIGMSNLILQRAAYFPVEITAKTLDAIHLATAETLSSIVDGIITFDKQMAKNAEKLGLKVFSGA